MSALKSTLSIFILIFTCRCVPQGHDKVNPNHADLVLTLLARMFCAVMVDPCAKLLEHVPCKSSGFSMKSSEMCVFHCCASKHNLPDGLSDKSLFPRKGEKKVYKKLWVYYMWNPEHHLNSSLALFAKLPLETWIKPLKLCSSKLQIWGNFNGNNSFVP